MMILGLGYAGRAVAQLALESGFAVTGTQRQPRPEAAPDGTRLLAFEAAGPAIREATHLLVTAAPEEATGDPVLARFAAEVAAAPSLRWVGYISTTGVYGDRGGEWVTEATPPAPSQPRSHRRLEAEAAWTAALAGRAALDLFRTAGIYGPGRNVLEELRAGRVRRVEKPGHVFSRIHRDDIARAVVAAALAPVPAGVPRVLHLADDLPSGSADVLAEGARLLGLPVPPAIPYAEALATMSPMGRSFWAENRKIGNAATKAALGLEWRYPSYREGLAAALG
jgi:nucleoside-diphosphate-sugar epimerase